MHNILVTGGAGYVGTALVPRLLNAGHRVTVYDMLFFGNHLPTHPRLTVIRGDVRDIAMLVAVLPGHDTVMHLACISNDPSFELDESLSRTMNYECFEPLVKAAKLSDVGRFIYCSTSSVYGISDSPDVTEDHPLVPLTLYNRYKGMCEPLLFKHQSEDFTCVTLRPSTVCGVSPRMRLDLSVNILTNLAVNKGVITVFGGAQMRPNIHIEDMVDVYELMLDAPKDKIAGQTFNVGQKNYSIMELARIVQTTIEQENYPPALIEVTSTMDTRSYQVSSDKIKRVLGYVPKRTVEDAVRDLCRAFKAKQFPDPLTSDAYYNVKQMRKVWDDVYKDAPPLVFDPSKGHMSEIDVMHR